MTQSLPLSPFCRAWRKHYLLILAVLPLVLAGLYAAGAWLYGFYRYDEATFTPLYQELYASPGAVAIDLERALQVGDQVLYAAVTGLKRVPDLPPAQPDLRLTILVDVDDRGYFHYLFFDFATKRRQTHYIKEVQGRWVATPQDAYFYFDSGGWLKVALPLTLSWWAILGVAAIVRQMWVWGERARLANGW